MRDTETLYYGIGVCNSEWFGLVYRWEPRGRWKDILHRTASCRSATKALTAIRIMMAKIGVTAAYDFGSSKREITRER